MSKLLDRSKQMVFVGYETGSKAYCLYDPETRKLVVSRDVVFKEDRPWDWSSSRSREDVDQCPLVIQYPPGQEQSKGTGSAEFPTAAEKSPRTLPRQRKMNLLP
jgi:hypothetical protein